MTDTATRTVYSGRSTNWPMIAISLGLLVPFLWAGATGDGSRLAAGFIVPVIVVVAAAVVTALTTSSVRTTAGPNGVGVHFGAFGRPRFRYPIDRIEHASAIALPPSMWTWGIVWSPRRGLLLTLRGGPALHLRLTNGRRVTISTPRPDAAVDAIDAARRG